MPFLAFVVCVAFNLRGEVDQCKYARTLNAQEIVNAIISFKNYELFTGVDDFAAMVTSPIGIIGMRKVNV